MCLSGARRVASSNSPGLAPKERPRTWGALASSFGLGALSFELSAPSFQSSAPSVYRLRR